ncbi:lipopolysaccharide biosynthesis protein [Chitinasiproducens palmae]|uniref:Polysaccharide transporter, PST family n=1 Tax=Chitinasiproducens palmae TaxID=1770053 RepID=A0A1H2PMI2_9BURK|nr:oligosaccharide flippase family protein [Chitinasiproducens palmae]SDV47810.1 polysaccharide transporter, PST family [Chitinasiproducens palmae]
MRLNHPDVRRALANLFWLAAERGTQIVVAIVIAGVMARYFGAEAFGKWQYASTLLLVLAPLTWVCGAELIVPAMVGASPARLATMMGSAFALRFGVSVAALIVTWAGLAVLDVDPVVATMLAGLAVTLLTREPFGVVNAWLQSRTHSRPALMISATTAVLKAGAVCVAAHMLLAPSRFGWLWAAEGVLGAILLSGYYARARNGRWNWRLDWHVDMSLLKHYARAGVVFWLALVCMYVFLKLDRLMLKHYIDYTTLGRYGAAQQLNENWSLMASMLAQTLAPAFIYRVSDPRRLLRNVLRLSMLTGIAMAFGALLLSAAAPMIVRIVFGPGFGTAVVIFRWAVWLSVLAGVEAVGNLLLLKDQARHTVLFKWLGALLASAVANLYLIPRFGVFGAVLGLAIGYGVAIGVNLCYFGWRRQQLR